MDKALRKCVNYVILLCGIYIVFGPGGLYDKKKEEEERIKKILSEYEKLQRERVEGCK